MTQEEQDRIYGRVVREEREAHRRFECLKAKAAEMTDKLSRVTTGDFVAEVLEDRISRGILEALPDREDLVKIANDLHRADADLTAKTERRRDIEACHRQAEALRGRDRECRLSAEQDRTGGTREGKRHLR